MRGNEGEALMQTTNRILDDLAKVASGAASTLAGVKQEVEGLVRQQLERFLADMELVTRDEFEAVKATAAHARMEQEKLEKRLAKLEAKLSAKPARVPRAHKAKAASKPARVPRGHKTKPAEE